MRTSGIKFDKYANGSIKSVTFNYKQHGEIIKPILQDMGAITENDFEKECKEGYTIDESKKELHKRIDKWWK